MSCNYNGELMAKFAHIADTHIRNLKYHKDYRIVFDKLFESLRDNKVDYIIHCGDLAHSKTQISPEFVELCSEFLIGLSEVAPTYIILGNHDGNLKNSSRQDAITPIAQALKLPSLHLLKNSGEVFLEDNKRYSLNVLSVFDRDNWTSPSNNDSINIALYHGSISNCETDLGWTMENGEDDITIFENFDYAFLGDIHKTNQVMDSNGHIRYCGSTIQQNFGETNDKGYLLWDISDKENYTCVHIPIKNPKPFITIELTPKGRIPAKTEISEGARLRLVSNNNLPLHIMRKATEAAKHRFKPERVTFLNRAAGQRGNVEELSGDFAPDNLRDVAIQEELIAEYLKDYQPSEELLKRIFSLNKKYNAVVESKEDIQRNVNWKLKTLEWNNLFNFGEGNEINFEKFHGTVGIFGKNYSGKSSIIDSILFTIYNSTSKNERKNLNVINQNQSDCLGKATVMVGDKEYTIERTSEKYVKKLKGEETLEAKTNVDFYVNDLITGERQSLNGVSRNETDKIIRKHFGTFEDFLLTSMSSQLGSLQFISEGSTKRKEILARFLDLEFFDQKYRAAKDDVSDLRGALKRLEGKEYDDEIYEIEKNLMILNNKTVEQQSRCEDLAMELETLISKRNTLEESINSIPAEIVDIEKITMELSYKQDKRDILIKEKGESDQKIINNKSILKNIETFLEDFDIDEVKSKKKKIDEKLSLLLDIGSELKNKTKSLEDNTQKIKLLEEVPCGDKFLHCKFIKDASNAKEETFDLREAVRGLQEEREFVLSDIDSLNQQRIESHLEKYHALVEKRNNHEKEILKSEAESEKIKNSLYIIEGEIENLLEKKEEYDSNKETIENKENLIKEHKSIKKEIEVNEDQQQECQKKVLNFYKDKGFLEQKIQNLKEQQAELSNLREDYTAYDLFMNCMHANGIAYDIIKKKLPVINVEIAKILANVVDFEVFFEADDKNLKIFIKHLNHEPRPIEMGSGAEKTLTAMAIRLAMLSVSSLPKSDIFILDEPGTALDAENMEGFVAILDIIKSYFKTVILISHLDSLKDCVDRQITIDKQEGYAFVQEI